MNLRLIVAMVALIAVSSRGGAAASGPWPSAKFTAENRKQCPRINLAELTDGTLTEETDRAVSRISANRRVVLKQRIHRRCTAEQMGFYCENRVTIQSMDAWGLTPGFVAHLCRQYRHCVEPAAC